MAKRVQWLRHTGTTSSTFVGRIGEITVDTTAKKLRLHDGETAGGIPVAREDLANVDAATAAVAGKMAAADKAKLDGMESGATQDQTGAEIKALYEAEANTNAFTDALKNDVEVDLPAADTALAGLIADEVTARETHEGDTANPHSVTKAQVGLGSVTDGAEINPDPMTTAEIVTGTETAERTVVPSLMNAAIIALAKTLKATLAQTLAAAIDTVFVTPLVQHNHPSAAKFWVNFNGGTGAIRTSNNVASVTKNSTGDYTINFTNNFSTAEYAASAMMSTQGVIQIVAVNVGSLRIQTYASSGGGFALNDPSVVGVIGFGVLA